MRFGKDKTHVRRSEHTEQQEKMNENTAIKGEQE
jgi:hypothetical protein